MQMQKTSTPKETERYSRVADLQKRNQSAHYDSQCKNIHFLPHSDHNRRHDQDSSRNRYDDVEDIVDDIDQTAIATTEISG